MPTEHVLSIMDQIVDMGFQGWITFRHLSESFLDPRVLDIVREAKKRGLKPHEATNGDYLRTRPEKCREAAELYESICVGLYDVTTPEEIEKEKIFWRERLKGTHVCFSEVVNVFWRSHTTYDPRMVRTPQNHPGGRCSWPQYRLIIHYDGKMALCCEDMLTEFDLGSAFETPIKDLWFSERYVGIINDLEEGRREKHRLCAQCPAVPSECWDAENDMLKLSE